MDELLKRTYLPIPFQFHGIASKGLNGMAFDVFRRDRADVFWIVGSGFKIRHAMTTRPRSVYTGARVPALCETWLLIPTATPWPQEPPSKTITERCPECTTIANHQTHHEHTWDY